MTNLIRMNNNNHFFRPLSVVFLIVFSFSIGQSYAQADKILTGTITQSTTATHSITLNPNTLIDGANGAVTLSIAGGPILNCVQLNATPSTNQNYVMTLTPREPFGIEELPNLSSKTACQVMQTIQYIDGLGRPLQTVQVKGNPNADRDVIMPVAYDQYGREATKYLPYTTALGIPGSYRPDALTPGNGVFSFYNPTNAGISGTPQGNGIVTIPIPSATTGFEASPLNRVVEQGAPGNAWQLTGSGVTGSGHTVKIEYASNDASAVNTGTGYWVRLYTIDIDANGLRTLNDHNTGYNANELYVTIIKDENWTSGKDHTTQEYKDKEGHVVLKRTFNGSEILSTYYVYDDFGNLCYVLPPKALADGGNISATTLTNLCYQYRYDERQRLTEKKVPGSGWQFIIYNLLDQAIMTQDANQRNKTPQEWSFTKYDALGRVVMTGIYPYPNSVADASNATPDKSGLLWLQNYCNTQTLLWESRDNNNTTGYSNVACPQGTVSYLTINYYDDYNFPTGTLNPSYPYVRNPSITGMPVNESSMTKGLLTASKVNVLGTTDMLWTVNYYDDKGRNIQSNVQHYLGISLNPNNHDEISTGYDFTNEVTQTIRNHYANGSNTLTVANSYVYDHMGRKRQSWSNINNNPSPILLSQTDYNEVGQLLKKQLHSEDSGASFLQEMNYAYNERGWLSQINDPVVAPVPTKLFSMKLLYTDPVAGHGSGGAQYNGNIAEQSYNKGSNGQKYAAYTYDALNRLTAGNSQEGYSENSIQYDLEGNIQSLQRFGPNIGLLSYGYYPGTNQLQTVTSDNNTVNRTYGYDPNGNATSDGKGNTINYNLLNLPQSIPGKGLSYVYSAAGQKLKKIVNGSVTEYIAGIEYKPDGTIDFVQTEEGRAIRSGTNYAYEYTLKDHLGNNRIAFDKVNGKVGEDDYYPFGLNVHIQQYAGNNYLYNGKEIQPELNDQYDYGARFYDPVIARWNAIDPKGEKFYPLSPYSYVADNPILLNDPNGKDWTITTEKDKDGNVTIHMHLSVAIRNSSKKDIDLNKFAQSLSAQLSKTYSDKSKMKDGDGKSTFTLITDVTARVLGKEDKPYNSEHLVDIKDPSSMAGLYGYTHKIGGKDVDINSKYVDNIMNGKDNNTLPHEFGHTLGLLHPDEFGTRLQSLIPWDITNQYMNSEERKRNPDNVMYSGDSGLLNDKNSTKITSDQINTIWTKYRTDSINKDR